MEARAPHLALLAAMGRASRLSTREAVATAREDCTLLHSEAEEVRFCTAMHACCVAPGTWCVQSYVVDRAELV